MRILGWVFRSRRRYEWAVGLGRHLQGVLVKEGWVEKLPGYGAGWTEARDLQALPEESFREWWRKEGKKGVGA